jgi:hypothetical protein
MAGEWLSQVSEDLRGHEAFTSYPTISDFAKGHLEKVSELDGKVKEADGRIADLNARLENSITIPGENATDEERKAFYRKVGVPDKIEGYEFDADNIEQATDKMFRELMLSSDIPKSSAKSVRKAFVDIIKQGTEAQAKAKADQEALESAAEEKAVNDLKDVWKGDLFKQNTEMASRAWKAVATWAGFSEAEAKAFVDETKIGNLPIGNHPFLLRVMHAVATKISDDSMAGGRGGGSGGQKSDEEAAKERFPNTKW